MLLLCCLYCQICSNFTNSTSIFIVDLENAGWDTLCICLTQGRTTIYMTQRRCLATAILPSPREDFNSNGEESKGKLT